MRRWSLAALAVAASACDGRISDALVPRPFAATVMPVPVALSGAPGFASEWGGGLFLGADGALVRLRADGTTAPLESHPANPVLPGDPLRLWPLGPASALVATSTGLFVEDDGWLIAPSWQAQLPVDGVVGVAVAADGVAWLAHAQGLYRLEEGALSELQLGGASVTGLSAVAVGPGPDGRDGIWYAQNGALFSVAQTSKTDFLVRPSGLSRKDLKGGVAALAGLTPSPDSAGEVWATTPSTLWRFTLLGWRRYDVPAAPTQLLAAGRFVWLAAGGRVYRFDGDESGWTEPTGLSDPSLLAVDATGVAWVQQGDAAAVVSEGVPARLWGLFQSEAVFDAERGLQLALPLGPGEPGPSAVSYGFDGSGDRPVDVSTGTQGVLAQASERLFSLGGLNAAGAVQKVSLVALGDGPHTLEVHATFEDGRAAALRTHFTLQGTDGAVLSWARDIQPLSAARCLACHGVTTAPELKTYDDWKANGAAIAAAVTARRMPADGPMAPASISAIERWVSGGMQP